MAVPSVQWTWTPEHVSYGCKGHKLRAEVAKDGLSLGTLMEFSNGDTGRQAAGAIPRMPPEVSQVSPTSPTSLLS